MMNRFPWKDAAGGQGGYAPRLHLIVLYKTFCKTNPISGFSFQVQWVSLWKIEGVTPGTEGPGPRAPNGQTAQVERFSGSSCPRNQWLSGFRPLKLSGFGDVGNRAWGLAGGSACPTSAPLGG